MSKTIQQLWRDEFLRDDHCILCCNTGKARTFQRTRSGFVYGAEVSCICPNGRALRTRAEPDAPARGTGGE